MAKRPFHGARLKVERAKQHVDSLRSTFDAFVKANPHTVSIETDAESGRQAVVVHQNIPVWDAFGLILGDAVHNLRTALDHAIWELAGLVGGKQDRYTLFPTGRDQQSYKAGINGRTTLPDDVRKFVTALAAYPDGQGRELYALAQLDISDKHMLITPILAGAIVGGFEAIHPDGRIAMQFGNGKFVTSGNTKFRIVSGPTDLKFRLHDGAYAAPFLVFGDVEFFKGEGVFETLTQIMRATETAIGNFENFFRART